MTFTGSKAATHPVLRGASLLLVLALGGCGQRGPLTLPAEAQPIQRASPPPAAAPAPGNAAEPGDTEADDESPANER